MKAKRVNPILITVLAVIVTGIITYLFVALHAGIRVTIANAGQAPLHGVLLHVAGQTYPVGDIAPGSSAKATIHAHSETGLKIELTDADEARQQLDAGVEIEPGYRGTMRIAIKDGAIVENEHDFGMGLP